MIKFKVKMWKWINPRFKSSVNEKYHKNDYMNIYVFDTYDEMYDFVDKYEKNKIERNYRGRCFTFYNYFINNITEVKRTAPLCGNIYFVKENMGAGTVTHECSHATIGYFNRRIKDYKKIFDDTLNYDTSIPNEYDDSCDTEELFCYMLDSLVRQIYNYYWKHIEVDE